MLDIINRVVEEPILNDINQSVAIGLEVDETTDISVSRQLDLHVRYPDMEGQVFNQFLDMISVLDGKANTIVEAIKGVLFKKGIPTTKLYGLGTAGAAVMTGRVNGVAKQLGDAFPWLVSVACAAHRLALSCKDASTSVPYMGTFRDHLQSLHLYFRNSANRTAALKMAGKTLGIDDLKVKEVKDTRWLSQDAAIKNLQRNLCAVLAVNRCPSAKGLYSFLATYRFVAAVYLQADVLPHLSCLSKLFQKEKVNFLALKYHVPVTVAALRKIKDDGDNQPPGSFLSQLNQDLDDPAKLSAFSIVHKEERDWRGRGLEEISSREQLWSRLRSQVMEPYLDALIDSLDRRFSNLDLLSAFHVLGPQAAKGDETENVSNLILLSEKFQIGNHQVLQEWASFRQHILCGAFQDMDQQKIMEKLAAQIDEWGHVYPGLSKLAAIDLSIPISSVNCEHDFSTLNTVKTDLRNRLQGQHLATCMRISINGPSTIAFNYQRALDIFYEKPRKIKCSQIGCGLCH